MLAALAACTVFLPPIVWGLENFYFGWHDVGLYTRALYNFFEFGRFAAYSDGSFDLFAEAHFTPIFLVLCLPVRLLGTAGYVGTTVIPLVGTAAYVFALVREATRSSWLAALGSAVYIANPYSWAIAMSYHPEAWGILLLLAFAYYARQNRRWLAWLAFLLALTVKEDMWIYGVVVALLVAHRRRWTRSLAFVTAAIGYYVVVVEGIGRWLYPTANYITSYYQVDDQPFGKLQIVESVLGRWREFLSLLFTGPGLVFQASFLCIGVFSGWRYLLACGVMLMWLTYPGWPPRSHLGHYYSYAALLMWLVILPFALVNLRTASVWLMQRLGRANLDRCGNWTVAIVLGLIVLTGIVMHVPGYIPAPIEETVVIDYRGMFGHPNGVDSLTVRWLIDKYLTADNRSVLAQFYIEPSIPQRRAIYVTSFQSRAFLEGKIAPEYVLLDLGAFDPLTPSEDIRGMVAALRRADLYRPLYDARQILLYERVTSEGQAASSIK